MASPGVPVVQAELVKCCRGAWEQADIGAGTCPALQGCGGSPPTFSITNPTMRTGCWFWDNSGGGRAVLIQGRNRFWLSRLWWW